MNAHLNNQPLIDLQPTPRPENDVTPPPGRMVGAIVLVLLILGAIMLNVAAAVLTGLMFGLL